MSNFLQRLHLTCTRRSFRRKGAVESGWTPASEMRTVERVRVVFGSETGGCARLTPG